MQGGAGRRPGRYSGRCGAPAAQLEGERRQPRRQRQQHVPREARQEPQHRQRRRSDPVRPVLLRELANHLGAQGGPFRAARDDHAGRGGDEQRRQLRDQAVADGQGDVGVDGDPPRLAVDRGADDEAAGDVDRRDEDADPHVAGDELAGAVHRAVEVRLPLQLGLPGGGLLRADQTGAVLRVDRHLFARQRFQREAGGHLGDAGRPLGDDHELHGDDEDEDDQTDHVSGRARRADHEGAERAHDLSREAGALRQDETGRGDVERQTEHRRDQQQGRKRREVQGVAVVQDDQDREQAAGDVDGHEEVEHERRQRDHQHGHARDHEQRHEHFAALLPAARRHFGHGERPHACRLRSAKPRRVRASPSSCRRSSATSRGVMRSARR